MMGMTTEAVEPLQQQQAREQGAGVVVVDAVGALAAFEALATFTWGDDVTTADAASSPSSLGLWPEAAAALAALGPRLLEAPTAADNTTNEEALMSPILRLRFATAMARGLWRLAAVVAAAAGVPPPPASMDDEEEGGDGKQRFGVLRASVQGILQSLLNAALAEAAGREGRQALFAYVLMVAAGSENEEGGDEGEWEGSRSCVLDPFLAAPGPVGVLLQAARDEDLEVRVFV